MMEHGSISASMPTVAPSMPATFIGSDEQTAKAFSYSIPSLGLDDGTFVFSYMGYFLSYITAHEVTVDMLREAIHTKISLEEFVLEALRIESGFIFLIIICMIASLLPLLTVLIWTCSKPSIRVTARTLVDDDGTPTAETLIAIDDAADTKRHCRRCLQIFLNACTILILAAVATMILTNEQASNGINKAPHIVKSSLKDTEQFTRNTYSEIASSVHESVNTAIERIRVDLENIDTLLGEPIQKDLESDTGIKTTLDSILGICSANYEIIHRIQLLKDALAQAVLISKEATQRTEEFRIQLAVLQRQCSPRDKPLCDTLRLRSFEDNGILDTFTRLQGDPNLLKMLSLGEYHSAHSHMNISTELKVVQQKFKDFPSDVKTTLQPNINDIEDLLSKMYESILQSTNRLTQTVESFTKRVDDGWTKVAPYFDVVQEKSHFAWGLGFNASLGALLLTLVVYGAFWLGVSHEERAARVTFVLGASLIAIGGIGLAGFTAFIMLIGAHGELFVCQPLYSGPDYHVVSQLVDKPGYIYANQTPNGIIYDLLQTINDTSPVTINTTLAAAITRCERGDASYEVFQLENLFNASKVTDLNEYDDLEDAIDKIFVSATSFATVTDPLEKIFDYMFLNSDVNFNQYRTDLSQPTPEKDLTTFVDQMQRVSIQIQEVATSSRMSTLGNRARRLISTTLQPMETLRNDILFHLTALQLQKEPWSEMVNQSLIHIRSTQYFLRQDAADICFNRSIAFKARLKNHLSSNRHHMLSQLSSELASCRPLFEVFDAVRTLTCRHIIDPFNGLWFASLVCLCLWSISTPISLALASIYGRMNRARTLRRSSSHQTPSESIIISEQSNWGSGPIRQRQSVRSNQSEQAQFEFEERIVDAPTTVAPPPPQQRMAHRRDVTFNN